MIILTSVFILASFTLISFIGMLQIQKSNEEFERVINEHNRQAELVTKMRDAARERMMELWRISLTKEPFARNASYEDFLGHATVYLEAREAFLQTELSEQEMMLYRQLNEATGKSSAYHRKIADQFMSGDPVSVNEMLSKTLPSQKDSLNALNRIIDLQAVESQQAFNKATYAVQRTVNLMIALTASTVFIGAILALIIYRNNAGMREALQQSNVKLLHSNQNLETRVAERTRQLQQANAKLQLLAHYDTLTGLANRALLTEQMAILLHQANREGKKMALLFLDLDGFKPINDEFGHDAGDQLLKVFAKRISGNIRSSDLVARIGGDEFVIVLSDIHELMHAETFAGMINATLHKPILFEGNELSIGVSIGISVYPDHGQDSEMLLKAADIAMYQAKRGGKNQFKVFDSEMLETGQGPHIIREEQQVYSN
jgi:diguanylate cyclase (GGDEF)-like protein